MGSRTGSLERVAPREAEQVSRGLEMRRAGTGGGGRRPDARAALKVAQAVRRPGDASAERRRPGAESRKGICGARNGAGGSEGGHGRGNRLAGRSALTGADGLAPPARAARASGARSTARATRGSRPGGRGSGGGTPGRWRAARVERFLRDLLEFLSSPGARRAARRGLPRRAGGGRGRSEANPRRGAARAVAGPGGGAGGAPGPRNGGRGRGRRRSR